MSRSSDTKLTSGLGPIVVYLLVVFVFTVMLGMDEQIHLPMAQHVRQSRYTGKD